MINRKFGRFAGLSVYFLAVQRSERQEASSRRNCGLFLFNYFSGNR
jgi:hypothetical protein